jgi:hypothetical protein
MQDVTHDFLVVEKGEPFHNGDFLSLPQTKILIGRSWENHVPDFSFSNMYVSRRHLEIEFLDGRFKIADCGSKHGTTINGLPLSEGTSHDLRHNDRIVLGRNEVIFIFCNEALAGSTWEYADFLEKEPEFIYDKEQQYFSYKDHKVNLNGQPNELFYCLFKKNGMIVSNTEIINEVWLNGFGIDDGNVRSLVKQLKDKLYPYGDFIENIRGRGYRLKKSITP